MSNRQFQNFCEYQLRGSQNRCFALPNFSFGKTTLNNNIHQNFPFALQSRVQSSHSIKMLPLTEVKGNLKN